MSDQPSKLQTRRVLDLLRTRGAYGLDQTDLLGPRTADGGPPITRLAARIRDLRDQGHKINVNGKRNKCSLYVLAEAAGVGQASATHPGPGTDPALTPAEPLPLFDPTPPPVSPYDDQIDTAA